MKKTTASGLVICSTIVLFGFLDCQGDSSTTNNVNGDGNQICLVHDAESGEDTVIAIDCELMAGATMCNDADPSRSECSCQSEADGICTP